MPINNKIQLRRGTSSAWSSISGGDGPVLAAGEPGFQSDSNLLKIGDGSTSWKDLKPIGSDQSLYKVKNTSGGIIYKGQVVRANGTVGNSDAIQVTTFIADGSVPEYTLMGLATQDMNNNDFGYITAFGQIQGIDTNPANSSTNICAAGETWIDGDILYASPSVSGKLTKVKPQHETIVAIVLNAADNGSLFVRPTWYPHLDDLHNVDSSGATNNQYLIYNSGTELWSPTSSGIFEGVDISSASSGATLLSIEGTNGNLFSVVDSVSGSLLSVNDITGLPAFEVFSDHSVVAGRFNRNDFNITSSGDIGIGTVNPSGKLHVVGSAYIDDLSIGRVDTTSSYQLYTYGSVGLFGTTKILGSNSLVFEGGAVDRFTIAHDYLNSLKFNTDLSSNALVIARSGNIGINTAAPSGKLDVNGEVYLGTSGTINNIYVRGVGVPEDRLKIRTDNFGSLYLDAGAAYVKAGGSDARVELVAGNSYINIGNDAAGTPANQYIAFRPANSEAMRIDAAGRVGIGGFGAGQSSYLYKLELKNAAPFFYPNETGEDAAALHLGRYSNGYGTFFSIKTHDESTYRTNFLINRFIGRYRFSIADGTLGTEHQAEIYPTTGGNALDLYNFNNEVKTKISAGTDDSYFNGGGKVGIGTSSPSSMLDIRTSGNPVLIARTSNGQNIFQYLKFDDTNLLRASFDGSNFHHYLDARLYYNIGTHGVAFDGGGGTNQSQVSITNRAYIALNSNTTSAPGNANIYAGPTAYATVDNQLTNISPIAIKTWAWNGSDGYTLGAVGYIKQTQNSDNNGDARLSIVEGATNSEILVVDYAKKNIGIGTTIPQSGFKLDVAGATVIRGSVLTNGNVQEFDNDRFKLNSGSAGNSHSYVCFGGANFGVGTNSPTTKLDVSGVITATGGNSTNWNTAYGWGNHASAGYQSASTALTTSTSFGGDVSGTYNNIVIADDSHNHIIGNVDGLQTALDGKLSTTLKGANNGLAELDSGGKVPSSQLPSYVDDVLEYAATGNFPATGETGKIYVATGTNLTYRWSGSAYVEISASLALGETSSTAYRGDRGKTAYDHSQLTTGSVHGSTTVGGNLLRLTNPSAIRFLRVNADNTVTALSDSDFRTAIGAGTSSTTGTVTSVGGTGTVAGLTLTGTVTTTGNLTLGGTLSVSASNFSSQTANTFLAAPNGSAGTPTFRAIVAADIPTLNQNTTGSANTLSRSGTPTTQFGTGLVGFPSQVASNVAGLFPATDNSNCMLTLNRHPGDFYSQLGFSSNGKLYYRTFNNTPINTTTTWETIWTSASLTNLNQLTNGPGYTTNTGTVTSVAALTLGTTGTDVSSTVANGTTTPVITLNIPTASASNRGALSSTDWTTFNNKAAANQTMYIGTTAVAINRGTGALSLTGVSIDGNAGTVTNGVYTTGSYADPSWITSINYNKLTGTIPTWNQNTTGSAATLTTSRTLWGQSFNGSANVTGNMSSVGKIEQSWGDQRVGIFFNNDFRNGMAVFGNSRLTTIFSTTNDATGGAITFNTRAGSGSSDTDYGTERMRINHVGNVGIGTNPSYKLDVSGLIRSFGGAYAVAIDGSNGNGPRLQIGSNTNFASYMELGAYASKNNLDTKDRDFRIHSTAVDPILYIKHNDGNVGIGTTDPGNFKLRVSYAVSNYAPVEFNGPGTAAWGVGLVIRTTGGTDGAAILFRNRDTKNWQIRGETSGTGFQITEDGGDANYGSGFGTPRVHISAGGNVGIGTATPGEKLEVNGNIKMLAGSYIDWGTSLTRLTDDASNGRTAIITRNNILDILNSAGSGWGTLRADTITAGITVSAGLKIKSTSGVGTSDYISLAVGNNGGTEAIRIINSGYVGINTSTPTYNLQVNGSFGATTKSFRIDHPSKPNYTLEYGSLESPYHGVRLTGRGKVVKGICVVDLPPYLKDLIHDDENINIQLTNLKHGKTLYVDDIDLNNSQFVVKCDRAKTVGDLEFFWTFTGVRKDVDHLVVEKPKEV